MILAVDTSLGSAVAVTDDAGNVRAEDSSHDRLAHAEVIGALLQNVLLDNAAAQNAVVDAGETPESTRITHVVAGMGPGPFTGLRIGIAAARTFALGRGIPVVPVPSHYAAALTELEHDPRTSPFAIVTDARRREVAVTVFAGLDPHGIPDVLATTVLVERTRLHEHLATAAPVVGAAADGIRVVEVSALSAAALARVGTRAIRAGRILADATPLYLRHPDVTLPGAPKRVGR